jgi:hypothetical protein
MPSNNFFVTVIQNLWSHHVRKEQVTSFLKE